jgi:virginiamycin B lyase
VGISAGRDWVWFVEILAGQVGRIDADGKIEEFLLPDRSAKPSGAVVDQVAFGKGTEPHGLTVTPDGNLWVALETGALAYVHS